MRRLSLVLLVGALAIVPFLYPEAGKAQQALDVRVNSVDVAAYPSVQTTLTVVDETGRPVAGLPPEAFTAEADGRQLPISTVAQATDAGLGIGLVLTFDVSGSMAGQPLAAAKQAGKMLIGQLGPEDQVAIVAFSDGVVHPLAFTQDRQAAVAAIDSLVATGNTALYQAVAESAATAKSTTLPRRAVVLLSDGVDFGGVSQVDAGTSLNAATASGAPYFVVGLGNDLDQGYLGSIGGGTRGQLLLAPAPDALNSLYQGIGAILRQQYVLRIDAGSVPPGSEASIVITVSSGGVTGSTETKVSIPGVLAPTSTTEPATPVATPVPSAVPPVTGEGGGGLNVGLAAMGILAGIAAAVVAGAAFVFFRRAPETPPAAPEIDFRRITEQPTSHLFPTVAAATAPESDAFLRLQIGDSTQTYPLGESPTTIGFGSDCTIRLPEGEGSGWERVRIWRREGRFMLHNLSRTGVVQLSGRKVTWAILEDGDEVQIGRSRMVFNEPATRSKVEGVPRPQPNS